MTDKTCNHGIRWVEGDTPTSRRPDYSEACNRPATGRSMAGHPRCDEHKARRWVVTVGFSMTITEQHHDTERQAMESVLARLGQSSPSANAPAIYQTEHQTKLSRMSARPATVADIERFEAIASQTLASVTVVGPLLSGTTLTPGIGGNNDAQGNGDRCHGGNTDDHPDPARVR